MEISKQVVKIKKLQMLGENLAILIPKGWSDELDWTRETRLVLEFLPHRQMMILSKKPAKAPSKLAPIYTKEGESQRDEREELAIEAEAQEAADDIMDIKEAEKDWKNADEKNSDLITV